MIEVNRKLFTRALDLVGATVVNRGSIPILSNIKVTANGSLRLEGTDLDNWTSAELPYEGETGEFTLPQPRMVRAALNQAGGAVVTVQPDEQDSVAVSCGKLHSDIASLPAADFPFTPRITFEDFSATLGAVEFKQIQRIMAAISSEETRYYLDGVNVRRIDDWTYRFCATDGHRMMVIDIPFPDAKGVLPDNTIIPKQWLTIAMQRFAKAKEGTALTFGRVPVANKANPDLPLEPGGPRIALRTNLDGITYSVTGKLIDGTFPDYTKVFPESHQFSASMRRADLTQAVHALAAMTFSRYRSVKLTFLPGKVCVELLSPDLAKSRFDVEAVHDVPEGRVVGLNGNYLLGMLDALAGTEVILGINGADFDPVLITDPADTAFKGLLMPIRVN